MKRVVILVADLDMKVLLEALIPRFEKVFKWPPVYFEVKKHHRHDAGCFHSSHEVLRPLISDFDHALVVFDFEGCGQDGNFDREGVAKMVEAKLNSNGWGNRAKVIVISPELENWIWVDSPKMYEIIFWKGERDLLLKKFVEKGWLPTSSDFQKPLRPKEALEFALKEKKEKFLPEIHERVGAEVSFKHCQDPAFLELIAFFQSINQ